MPLAGLGAFAVRKVTRGVAKGKTVVGRHVACAEARTAERRLDDRAGFQQSFRKAAAREGKADGNAGRVDRKIEIAVSGAFSGKNRRSFADVVKQSAAASGDNALIGINFAVAYFGNKVEFDFAEFFGSRLFHIGKNIGCVFSEFVNGVGVGRVERQGDHRFDFVKFNGDQAVVVGCLFRS